MHVSRQSVLVAFSALCLTACATTAVDTASGSWHEVRTARFSAVTDADPQEAAALLQDLERFHGVVQRVTTADEREGVLPVQIWIARNAKTFRALTKLDSAGVFKASALGNLAFVTAQHVERKDEISSRHILFHEYTHYLIAVHGARIPSWYNEGLAEYLGTTKFTPDGAYRLGCPPRFRTRWTSLQNWLPMATVMESPNVGALVQGEHRFFQNKYSADPYTQSWYAVHYFSATEERQRELARYLELVGNGTPGERAVEEAFGHDYTELDGVLQAYAARRAFDCVEVVPAEKAQAPEVEVRPLSKGEAHYRIGQLVLAIYGDLDIAREALQRALSLEPGHAGAHAGLARVHLRAAEMLSGKGSDSSTEKALTQQYLERARAIEPKRAETFAIEGHLHFLKAQQAIRREDKTAANEAVMAARKAYRRAINLDNASADALLALGLTYLLEDDGAEEGQVAFEGAAYLLPLDPTCSIGLAKVHLARNQPKLALAPLDHAQRWARSDEQRAAVEALIDEARRTAP